VELTDPDDVSRREQELRRAQSSDAEPDHLARLWSLLGAAYRRRFRCHGDPADLDHAVRCFQAAHASGDADRAAHANNLAVSLTDRYDEAGQPADLAEAVRSAEEATALVGQGSADWAEYAGTLAVCLWDRYDATGFLADLDRAMELGQRALAATAPGAPGLARLCSNVGMLRLDRYERLGEDGDLQAAVALSRAAVAEADADDPELAGWLNNLGNVLRTRFAAQFGDHESPLPDDSVALDDLNEAIDVYRAAVGLSPSGQAGRATFLSNLGNALVDRSAMHHLEGQPDRVASVLGEAVEALDEAVSLTPATAPYLSSRLNTLGVAQRFRADETGSTDDVVAARRTLRRACDSGLVIAPEMTVAAADNWVRWAVQRSAWDEVDEADGYLLRAAESLQRAQVLRRHQEAWLISVRGLAQEAAYACVRQGRPADAAARLERGRAVLLTEVLELLPRALDRLPDEVRARHLLASQRLASAKEQAEGRRP
jgi:hypothetical protein